MASVLGMLFLALVFLVAIGTQVYLSGLQAQSNQAGAQAIQRDSQRSREGLAFGGASSGITATDSGPTSETLLAMILKFENGTVYTLNSGSSPAFVPATLPSNGRIQVQPLVPAGTCSPGSASCLSKFNSIVNGGGVAGRALGLVTSLGNVFWYLSSSNSWGQGLNFYRTTTLQTTSSTSWVGVTGLSFGGSANAFYAVQIYVSFYQTVAASQGVAFSIAIPSGTTFLFCGGMVWADPNLANNPAPGNACTGTPNASLGPTTGYQTTCTNPAAACQFVGTAFVAFGSTAGQFQIQYEASTSDTNNVLADSVIVVTQAS
ncbi:MAG: hypothetical protein HY297_03790 [Thaumarchaeota archaeon]|nr:hypothetical protein [Nitrososphaerota archaeon]